MATRVRALLGHDAFRVEVAGTAVTIEGINAPMDVREAGDGRWRVSHAQAAHVASAALAGDVVWVAIEGELFAIDIDRSADTARANTRGRDALSAPMPATVVRVAVQVGAHVTRGETLIVLEAMKMELAIKAPLDGRVAAVHCREGQLVQAGAVLIDLE